MTENETHTGGTPRWVKVFGVVILVLVLLFVVLRVSGVGGQHGPARHTLGGDTSGANTPPSGVTTAAHARPPPGVMQS
jgi:hypothetical protein